MPAFPNKILMKTCSEETAEAPHPCDPPTPCDVCNEGSCPDPKLCKEALKNSQPGWRTRCKPGPKISVEVCSASSSEASEHPCDPPPKCIPGKPKVWPCTIPSLCRERVKNLQPKDLRCHPDPEDYYSRTLCENMKLLQTKVNPPPNPSCRKEVYYDPHTRTKKKEEEKIEVKKPLPDPNEYKYSRTLCKYMDLLKTPIPTHPKRPCPEVYFLDPFANENELRKKAKCYIDPNPCLERDKKD